MNIRLEQEMFTTQMAQDDLRLALFEDAGRICACSFIVKFTFMTLTGNNH
jgi:hypothetical protein